MHSGIPIRADRLLQFQTLISPSERQLFSPIPDALLSREKIVSEHCVAIFSSYFISTFQLLLHTRLSQVHQLYIITN